MQGRPLSTRPFLITYVESALGLMNLRDIFKKTIDLQLKEQLYVLDGVVFGSDDFCADIGEADLDQKKNYMYFFEVNFSQHVHLTLLVFDFFLAIFCRDLNGVFLLLFFFFYNI